MDSTRSEFLSSPRIILILSPIGALAVVYIIYDVFLQRQYNIDVATMPKWLDDVFCTGTEVHQASLKASFVPMLAATSALI